MVGIYKITNTLNDKCYIGQSIDIQTRWTQHIYAGTHNIARLNKSKFYQAIKEDGIENFSFEILELLSREELNTRERYWIQYYDSYKNGYNSTPGGYGESSWFFDPELIQSLWDDGYCISEIAHFVNCSVVTVGRRLKNYKNYSPEESYKRTVERRIYRNFEINQRRSYKLDEINNNSCKKIYQYDLNGKFLREFSSIKEAGLLFNTNSKNGYRNIYEALKNKQPYAYGYLWSLNKVDTLPSYNTKIRWNSNKKVKCIETQQKFDSLNEAAKWCGLSSGKIIGTFLSGKRKSAGKHPITNQKLHWQLIE